MQPFYNFAPKPTNNAPTPNPIKSKFEIKVSVVSKIVVLFTIGSDLQLSHSIELINIIPANKLVLSAN